MRLLSYITKRVPKLAGLAFVAILAACSDSPIAPSAPSATPQSVESITSNQATLAADFVSIDLQYGWLPKLTPTTTTVRDTVVQKFTVNPLAGALISFGANHRVVIYPWSICNPATSGYGPSYWLKTCSQATTPITFTFKSWTNAQGRPSVDVSPNVRFVPNSMVRLYFHDSKLTNFNNVVIPYCNSANVCVDEGVNDPFQQTWYAPGVPGFWVFRNLRHFSAYNVAA